MTELRTALPPITLTSTDVDRLERLVTAAEATFPRVADFLARELGRATLVESDARPAGVIAMGSKVTFRDDATADERTLTLVYPDEANLEGGKISVLSPIGAALLGLSAGQSIEWQTPAGGQRSLTVLKVDGVSG
jgi:regulator of nucleoside diphosphate kinase